MSRQLEARPDAIESRFAIDALIADCAEALDATNVELLATLWQPESRLLPGANGNAHGLEAILGQARVNMTRMPHVHHWMANALVTVEGDDGHGLVTGDCLFNDVDQGTLQVSGRCRDIYQRREGRRAFVERTVTMHHAPSLENWLPIRGTERFGRPA